MCHAVQLVCSTQSKHLPEELLSQEQLASAYMRQHQGVGSFQRLSIGIISCVLAPQAHCWLFSLLTSPHAGFPACWLPSLVAV